MTELVAYISGITDKKECRTARDLSVMYQWRADIISEVSKIHRHRQKENYSVIKCCKKLKSVS
jgi:hypothetical protein